jgi:hypothetical protein
MAKCEHLDPSYKVNLSRFLDERYYITFVVDGFKEY